MVRLRGPVGHRADVDVVITFWNFLSRVAFAWVECNWQAVYDYRVSCVDSLRPTHMGFLHIQKNSGLRSRRR